MTSLSGSKILVGVTGGIAAYKAAELVRELKKRNCDVRVVATSAALEFVTALTFQALSGHPVSQTLLDADEESAMGHISLARWADRIVIAPATADVIARLAAGMANDLLTTVCLAATCPITLAPAMNQAMWRNAATQANVAILKRRGLDFLGPAEGDQACGENGPGRLLEPTLIADALQCPEIKGPLKGLKVMITAGPTREPIDPVRYLTNRSSGRMGYAIAEAARDAGAEVTLVTGPTALAIPRGLIHRSIETAAEMHEAVMSALPGTDIFIGAAAVADYAPEAAPEKIKKAGGTMDLALFPTRDILTEVANQIERPFTVGFAAETEQLEAHALAKLNQKKLDLIAANTVGKGLGFEVEDNALLILWNGGRQSLERAPKRQLADQLISLIADHYHAKHPAQDS